MYPIFHKMHRDTRLWTLLHSCLAGLETIADWPNHRSISAWQARTGLTRIGAFTCRISPLKQLLLFHGLVTVHDAMYVHGLLAFNCGPTNTNPKLGLLFWACRFYSPTTPGSIPRPRPKPSFRPYGVRELARKQSGTSTAGGHGGVS
jgi:hypothetical protein